MFIQWLIIFLCNLLVLYRNNRVKFVIIPQHRKILLMGYLSVTICTIQICYCLYKCCGCLTACKVLFVYFSSNHDRLFLNTLIISLFDYQIYCKCKFGRRMSYVTCESPYAQPPTESKFDFLLNFELTTISWKFWPSIRNITQNRNILERQTIDLSTVNSRPFQSISRSRDFFRVFCYFASVNIMSIREQCYDRIFVE